MTRRQEMVEEFSDYHKEAYGFRPRLINFRELTIDELDRYFKQFQAEIDKNDSIRELVEAEAVVNFEKLVKKVQRYCSCTKDKAIEYLMDAEGGVNGDTEYFCYLNNLPYGYFKKAA